MRAKDPLTNFSVKDLFLSVAYWFNDLEKGLKEAEVTQPPSLIIELLPLCFLQAEKKKTELGFLFHLNAFMKAKCRNI